MVYFGLFWECIVVYLMQNITVSKQQMIKTLLLMVWSPCFTSAAFNEVLFNCLIVATMMKTKRNYSTKLMLLVHLEKYQKVYDNPGHR